MTSGALCSREFFDPARRFECLAASPKEGQKLPAILRSDTREQRLLPERTPSNIADRPRLTLAHHPSIQVLTGLEAPCDVTVVPITVQEVASNISGADLVGKRKRRTLAAAVALSRSVVAPLATFRRIDTMQPDTLTPDLDRVAVDNSGAAE
jgi:hypothetical protein